MAEYRYASRARKSLWIVKKSESASSERSSGTMPSAAAMDFRAASHVSVTSESAVRAREFVRQLIFPKNRLYFTFLLVSHGGGWAKGK